MSQELELGQMVIAPIDVGHFLRLEVLARVEGIVDCGIEVRTTKGDVMLVREEDMCDVVTDVDRVQAYRESEVRSKELGIAECRTRLATLEAELRNIEENF